LFFHCVFCCGLFFFGLFFVVYRKHTYLKFPNECMSFGVLSIYRFENSSQLYFSPEVSQQCECPASGWWDVWGYDEGAWPRLIMISYSGVCNSTLLIDVDGSCNQWPQFW
jgi:hypothetical protein